VDAQEQLQVESSKLRDQERICERKLFLVSGEKSARHALRGEEACSKWLRINDDSASKKTIKLRQRKGVNKHWKMFI
jgi:hypothetical protein